MLVWYHYSPTVDGSFTLCGFNFEMLHTIEIYVCIDLNAHNGRDFERYKVCQS